MSLDSDCHCNRGAPEEMRGEDEGIGNGMSGVHTVAYRFPRFDVKGTHHWRLKKKGRGGHIAK